MINQSDISHSLTDEWLHTFDTSLKNKEVLRDSIFWRLALYCLPEGVDPTDIRVKSALKLIRISIEEGINNEVE